jgi:cellulose synthase/poly-beta-1,6-N-acetylglucosamine synthase-like glycosyltransferase
VGRNAGWRVARGEFVLFLDGDTVLHPDFVARALAEMTDPAVAVVWGHRREMAPGQSVYVRVLDLDWVYPPGPSAFCGGDALMRRDTLEAVGGFDDSLIAGEEPELSRRIRARGQHILHIDAPMTLHDLAITRFSAYWRRAFRAGHAYAEVSARFKDSADPLWRADARRNLVHGSALLAAPALFAASLAWPPLTAALILGGAALVARTARRCRWKTPDSGTRLLYALHAHFQQVPILFGQLSQRLDARRGRRRALIEYKESA